MNLETQIKSLADAATNAHDSCDALRFSQAAQNLANTMNVVEAVSRDSKQLLLDQRTQRIEATEQVVADATVTDFTIYMMKMRGFKRFKDKDSDKVWVRENSEGKNEFLKQVRCSSGRYLTDWNVYTKNIHRRVSEFELETMLVHDEI